MSVLRVRPRPTTAADTSVVSGWLPEAAAAISGRGSPVDPCLTLPQLLDEWRIRYPNCAGVALEHDGAPVGLAIIERGADGLLLIHALTMARPYRDRGLGHEAVMALERSFAGPGAIAAAGVPHSNGLSIYFWLRCGYRPDFPRGICTPALPVDGRSWLWRQL